MFNQLYKWHHRIGLFITIPILGWCISGLTHPMMAHLFKIKPAKRFVLPRPIKLDSSSVSLEEALKKHHIEAFSNFRLIDYKDASYYQIIKKGAETIYINTKTNTRLENGDELYAVYLARYFLGDETSPITATKKLNQFTFEYKFINRLLPVYKISFDREDRMDVYVETNSSRLGTMNNWTRKTCIAIFSYLHNWSFLKGMPNLKLFLMLTFMAMSFFVAASGLTIYGFLWKTFEKQKPSKSNSNRKWHRRVGLMVSISTLGFAFSGGYHAFAKSNAVKQVPVDAPIFASSTTEKLPDLIEKTGSRLIKNISMAQIGTRNFFQVAWIEKAIETSYFEINNLEQLGKGEEQYAIHLASKYSNLPADRIVLTTAIQKFEGEYGFINKRLPVRKVQYETDENHSVYVETSSGKLAANISAPKRLEALSFLMLHKYHFIDPIGKTIRDLIIVILVLGIMLVNILGLVLWLKK